MNKIGGFLQFGFDTISQFCDATFWRELHDSKQISLADHFCAALY